MESKQEGEEGEEEKKRKIVAGEGAGRGRPLLQVPPTLKLALWFPDPKRAVEPGALWVSRPHPEGSLTEYPGFCQAWR